MSRITWKVYPEKTGNPVIDNRARNANRRLSKTANNSLRFLGMKNRKRKKYCKRIEGGNYVALIAAIANDLAKKAATR